MQIVKGTLRSYLHLGVITVPVVTTDLMLALCITHFCQSKSRKDLVSLESEHVLAMSLAFLVTTFADLRHLWENSNFCSSDCLDLRC